MHEKNLNLPLPPLPEDDIGRKALLGVGFRGKGKSPSPLPLPLPSRVLDRSAGLEGNFKTLPGGRAHSPGTSPVAEAGLRPRIASKTCCRENAAGSSLTRCAGERGLVRDRRGTVLRASEYSTRKRWRFVRPHSEEA